MIWKTVPTKRAIPRTKRPKSLRRLRKRQGDHELAAKIRDAIKLRGGTLDLNDVYLGPVLS